MATINQIRKQIETANKNIAAYEKKNATYSERLDKAVSAINKLGANFSVDQLKYNERFHDYSMPETIYQKYDYMVCERIVNNANFLKDNQRRLEMEIRRRNEMAATLDKMVADEKEHEQATAGLHDALESAMADFRVVWFEKMEKWYDEHFHFVNRVLEEKKQRRERAKNIMRFYTHRNGYMWEFRSRRARFLNNIIKNCTEIISDDAAHMEYDAYMAKMKQETIRSWNAGINLLTDKCHKFGLDEQAINVQQPSMTSKGFSAIITDGKQRYIDVRVIWAAEYSVLVTPHIRYIATQKSK